MSVTDPPSFATPEAIQEAARRAQERVQKIIEEPLPYDGATKTPAPDTRTLAQRVFDAVDITSTMHEVPEWGVTFELRSPTGEERSSLQQAFIDMDASQAQGEIVMRDLKQMWPAIIITCCYDPETGERAFEMTPATVAELNKKNGAVVERLAQACMPVVGLTSGDVEEKKAPS